MTRPFGLYVIVAWCLIRGIGGLLLGTAALLPLARSGTGNWRIVLFTFVGRNLVVVRIFPLYAAEHRKDCRHVLVPRDRRLVELWILRFRRVATTSKVSLILRNRNNSRRCCDLLAASQRG
jgi:hypothetical protein